MELWSMPVIDMEHQMSRDVSGRFLTGGKPGPGRPIGSRNKLAERFLADICVDWAKYGAAVISKVRNKNPTAYFRVVASILPRDVPTPIQKNEFDHLTDEELGADLIRTVGLLQGEEQLE